MTANEDVSLDAIDLDWVAKIASDREALRDPIVATQMAPAFAMTIRALIAELRSRASIGPDSERTRELEAENERNEAALMELSEASAALRADHTRLRHLLGPDKAAVDREDVESAIGLLGDGYNVALTRRLRAALSQPHPEETPKVYPSGTRRPGVYLSPDPASQPHPEEDAVSDLVPAESIESIVGAERHPNRHLARAVRAEQTVYILHSYDCLESGIDLRDCDFSRALDNGIRPAEWPEDVAVAVAVHENRLVPTSQPHPAQEQQ
jgi:hypothetical protein